MNEFGTTLTSDLKGGDAVVIGGRVREVFDTVPVGFGGTVVRYLNDRGEVESLRTYANDTLMRVPFENVATSARAAGR